LGHHFYFIFLKKLSFDEGANNEQPAHCCHCLFNFFGLFVVIVGGGNEQYTCCHSFVILKKNPLHEV